MKAKISRGSDFGGLCRYVLGAGKEGRDRKRAEVIGGNIPGAGYDDLMGNFGLVRRLRPDIRRPVWHCSLSFPPGENLDSRTLARIA